MRLQVQSAPHVDLHAPHATHSSHTRSSFLYILPFPNHRVIVTLFPSSAQRDAVLSNMGQAQIAQRLEEEATSYSLPPTFRFLCSNLVRMQERVRLQGQKAFARTIDDDDLNSKWKGVERWGDPLALKSQVCMRNEHKALLARALSGSYFEFSKCSCFGFRRQLRRVADQLTKEFALSIASTSNQVSSCARHVQLNATNLIYP